MVKGAFLNAGDSIEAGDGILKYTMDAGTSI